MICHNPAGEKSLLRNKVDIPTHEEDLKLLKNAKKGNIKARNELIVRHLPAMIQFASGHYKARNRPTHLELEDLIHVCVFGMVHAIRKFDQEKTRGRFIQYARHWMRNYIDKAIEEYKLYRIPVSTKFAYSRGKLCKKSTKLAIDHYREMVSIPEDQRVYDNRLSPEEEAIFNEECDLVRNQRTQITS